MKSLVILLSILFLSNCVYSATASEFQCLDDYENAIDKYYPPHIVQEYGDKWIYKFKGYYWLTKVVGKPAAVFTVGVVPGAIPAVLTLSSVSIFFDTIKKKKGKLGAYIILKMSEIEESEFANQDLDSKLEEEVLNLKEYKYKRRHNFFGHFVKKVNRKYRNTHFSYEEVRRAVVELALKDRKLCQKSNGKIKLTTLRGLIRLTKKKLISRN